MPPEEPVALICTGIGAIAWIWWYLLLIRISWLGRQGIGRGVLAALPVTCALGLYAVLDNLASFDVRDSTFYLYFYMAMGAAWIGLWQILLPVCGIGVRDDAIERRNAAALWPIIGALLALTLCYAGGNIGDGPGYWVVLLAAGIATGALAALWFALEQATNISELITIDRSHGAGLRLGLVLLSLGLILGCGVAGDWISFEQTLADAQPYLLAASILTAAAIAIELMLAFGRRHLQGATDFLGFLLLPVYPLAAAGWLQHVGWWS